MEHEQLLWAPALPGLTGYATRAFIAVARCHRASATDVADDAGIPKQRVYDVLTDLVSRGIVIKHAGRPVTYEGIDPLDAVQRLAAANRAALICQEERMQALAEDLRIQWLKARNGYSRPVPPGRVEPAHLNRWGSIATSSVAATAPTALDDREATEWLASLQRLVAIGGTARYLCGPDVREDARHFVQARKFGAAGQETRVVAEVQARWVVVDGSEALVPLPSAPSRSGRHAFILIEQPAVVNLLVAEFETLWQRATPLSQLD